MVILDSNVWIAYLNKQDSQHKKAERIFLEVSASRAKIAITEYVILETVSVLAIRAGKNIADRFLITVIDNKDIIVINSDSTFFSEVSNLFLKQNDGKLSFVDVSLLLMSKEADVITFDKNLRKKLGK